MINEIAQIEVRKAIEIFGTQKKMAEKIGLHQSLISSWLTNKLYKKISYEKARKIIREASKIKQNHGLAIIRFLDEEC